MLSEKEIVQIIRENHRKKVQKLLKKVEKRLLKSRNADSVAVSVFRYDDITINIAREELEKRGWKVDSRDGDFIINRKI